MTLRSLAEAKIQKFTMWDMGFIKICLVSMALLVAKLWPKILSAPWYWYGSLFIASYAWILWRMFKSSRTSS